MKLFFSGSSKIVSYNKSGKNLNEPLNFTKLFLVGKSSFVLTFNKQSIFIFDVKNLESVDRFHRRFGEIREVFVDESNIFVWGSSDTVLKFQLKVDESQESGEDESDFVSTVKNFIAAFNISKIT
jgi:glutamine cyclotransferase